MNAHSSTYKIAGEALTELLPRKVELEARYNEVADEYARVTAAVRALEAYQRAAEGKSA